MKISLELSLIVVVIATLTHGASIAQGSWLRLGLMGHGSQTHSAHAIGLAHVDDRGNALARFGRLMNTCTNASIRAATTNVGHRLIDVLIAGFGISL